MDTYDYLLEFLEIQKEAPNYSEDMEVFANLINGKRADHLRHLTKEYAIYVYLLVHIPKWLSGWGYDGKFVNFVQDVINQRIFSIHAQIRGRISDYDIPSPSELVDYAINFFEDLGADDRNFSQN